MRNKTFLFPAVRILPALFLLCILFSVPAFADSVVTAQRTDDLNCSGNGIREISVAVPARTADAVPIAMPEDGALRISCNLDSYVALTRDRAGRSPVYSSNGILGKGTYYYQVPSRQATLTYKFKAWYYPAGELALPLNGSAVGVAFAHEDGFVQSQLFRISVPARGWIKVSVDLPNGVRAAPMIGISTAGKRLFSKAGTLYEQNGNYPAYVAVEKGTYYLFAANVGGQLRMRCEYSGYGEKNYSRKKAKTLKAGRRQASVVYSKDKGKKLTRVYRIKLKKKKKVRISYETPYAVVSILDKKGKIVPMGVGNGFAKTRKKLKKGTYYLVLKFNFGRYRNETMGEVTVFSWN